MTAPTPNVTRTSQLEHLAQVKAPAQAIASAISAIESNDLAEFETYLAAQETICYRLSSTKWTLSPTAAEQGDAPEKSDQALLLEIRQAYIGLAQLNRVYAAVLKRTRKSLGLIAALYRSHRLGYDREPYPVPQSGTWSCEV